MNSKSLVMVVSLLGLFQISLIGCGQKASANKVTTTRAKKANPAAVAAAKAKAAEEKASASAGNGAGSDNGSAVGSGTGAGSKPSTGQNQPPKILTDKEAIKQILIKNNCEVYYDRVQKDGWEITISINGNGNNEVLTYMNPRGSQLKNPVLVLSNSRSQLSAEESNALLKKAKQKNFDPIYFDVPGFGCSDPLPNLNSAVNKAELAKFSSQSVADLIEKHRSVILKNEKWKIWSQGNASLIALRLVEKYPDTIKSLHFADFVFSDQPTELMKKRILKQVESWKIFKAFAKEKDLEITDALMERVMATLEKKNCSSNQKICKKDLLSVLVTFLSQDNNKWLDAVKAMKILSEGKISDALNQRAQQIQKHFLYDQFVKATDLDVDATLSACEKALKDAEVIEKLKESPLNSCQLEAALKDDYKKSLESQVSYQKLDYALIKKNLTDKKINLHLAIGERSLMNPLSAVEDMGRLIGEDLIKDNLISPEDGSFLFMNEALLKSL